VTRNLTREQQSALMYWRIQVFYSSWIGYFGIYLCRKTVSAAHAWTQQFHEFSTLIFVFSLAYVIGQLIAGTAADRFGGRIVGLIGALMSAACTLGMIFAPSLLIIFALQMGNGLGQGCGYPSICKILGAWFCRRERGVVLAWWSTSYSLGGFLATALLSWLAGTGGTNAAGKQMLGVPAVLLALIAVYWYFRTRNSPADVGVGPLDDADAKERAVTWPALLRNKEIQLLAGMYFFLKLTRYSLLLWLPLYLVQSLKYSEHFAAYTASLFELAGLVGMLSAGYISDRLLDRRRYPLGTVMLFALAFVCLMHPVLSGLGWWTTSISICLMGMLIYGPDVLMTATTVLEAVPSSAHGRAAAYVNGVGSAGQMLSPFIVSGFVQRFGWDSLFNLFVICALIAGTLLAVRWDEGTTDHSGGHSYTLKPLNETVY
jgi:sugar phosphate permease